MPQRSRTTLGAVRLRSLLCLTQRQAVEDVRRKTEPTRNPGVIDRCRIEQDNADRTFIEVHVGCGLEDFGGSVEELVGFFPERDYELYGSNDLDRYPKPFVGERRQLAGDRFYLIAIAKDPPA